MDELELIGGDHNPNKICNIIKVNNIQQSDNIISGIKVNKLHGAKEMFAVYTDDNKYSKLYTLDETEKILPDLLSAGYISYADYHGFPFEGKGGYLLKRFLKDHLMAKSQEEYEGVAYTREELAKFKGKLCVVHGGKLHWECQDLPAFRYSVGNSAGTELSDIISMGGYVLYFPQECDFEKYIDDICAFYKINQDGYEYSDIIEKNENRIWREELFLLSSDDSLVLIHPKGGK